MISRKILHIFSRFASYNGLTGAAAAAARDSPYFGSASAAVAANSFGPYAAAYAATQNMMNWNSYSLATYQGLQREGVTYGRSKNIIIAIRDI